MRATTRMASVKIFKQCRKCEYRKDDMCCYKYDKPFNCTYKRKSKKLNCPLS